MDRAGLRGGRGAYTVACDPAVQLSRFKCVHTSGEDLSPGLGSPHPGTKPDGSLFIIYSKKSGYP